ncbi:MAG: ribonuclease D [Gammaproteobacteria bacterium]|nr:ribonuclease D [Gammaproteobacteria bacterium]
MDDVIYIEDQQALRDVCGQLCGCNWLAIDTEFIREKTYFPQLALIQITNTELIYCIDPLAIDDLSALYELLENPAITKVFHAASQDLEIFFHLRQCVPQPIFDTQVAASLLGLGEQIGYAALVEKVLNIELDKSHSRTNWMQRPLQSKQIRYAADDVRYLSRLYPLLYKKLEKLGRIDWMDSEVARLQNPATYKPDPPNCWQRVKGSGNLKRKPLNILRHLAAWREHQAMQANRPRRWILSDEVLINLATHQPMDRDQLLQVPLLDSKIAERHATDLLGLIDQAQNETEENWPAVRYRKKPSAQEEANLDLLMAVIHLRADEYRLSSTQITSRSELLKLLRGERDLPLLGGWRLKVAGQAILDTYQSKMLRH